jgi:hypothetical protein
LKSKPAKGVTEPKFFALFLFLLTYLVLYPYIHLNGASSLALRIFGSVVTILSVYAVSFRRGFVFIALALAIPALAQRIILPRADAGVLALGSIIFGLVFDVFIVVAIFRRVFMKDEPTAETLYGALCIYLLVGFGFTTLYDMLVTLQPHAFYLDPASNAHHVPDQFDLVYYSFATLTSLGGAGITPVSEQARSTTVIEALLGVLYLAVLISRLLDAYRERERNA